MYYKFIYKDYIIAPKMVYNSPKALYLLIEILILTNNDLLITSLQQSHSRSLNEMLKFTLDQKTGKTLVQRKTDQTKKTVSGKTYVVYDVLGFIERRPIDITTQQKLYSIAENVTPQQKYILTRVCTDLANVLSTVFEFRASSKALELTKEERAEVESKVKELSQYYKNTLCEWFKVNREIVKWAQEYVC